MLIKIKVDRLFAVLSVGRLDDLPIDPYSARPCTLKRFEKNNPGAFAYLLFIGVTGWWALRGARAWRGTASGAFLIGLLVALALTYAQSSLERVLTQTKNLSTWMILIGVVARLETARKWKTLNS